MNDQIFTYLFVGVIGGAFWLLIMYFLYRWIFSIKRQLWNQKMQIELLIIIAQKLGVDTETEDFKRLKKANRGTIDIY